MLILLLLMLSGVLHGATYYIDFAGGSDSNNGTSKSTPWKHSPGMVACSGTCATTTPQPGDQFIFKGGVTWDSTALPITVAWSGSSGGGAITFGADVTWFAGVAWTRPVFDSDYNDAAIFSLGSVSYVNIDNLELANVASSANFGYGLISGYAPSFLNITNCYLHGWKTSNAADDAHGGVVFVNYGPNVHTIVIDNCEIENTENESEWSGVMARMVGTIKNSHLHHNSSAVLFCLDFDNNIIHNISYPVSGFDSTYHYNGVYLDAAILGKTVGYIRNSVFYDIGGGANMSYLNGRGATIYNYNNVYYGEISSQMAIEIEPYDYGANQTSGTYLILNNTGFLENGSPLVNIVNRGGSPQPESIVLRNNHVIGTGVTVDNNGPAASYTRSNNLIQTVAEAEAQGYTVANRGKTAQGNGGTVGAGFDGSAYFTVDADGVARGSSWDIGAYEYAAPPQRNAVTGRATVSGRVGVQ